MSQALRAITFQPWDSMVYDQAIQRTTMRPVLTLCRQAG
jgi:hypothetical protein